MDDLSLALQRTENAISKLWSEEHRCFFNYDLVADEVLDEITTGTVLPLFAGLASQSKGAYMADLIDEWLDATAFALSSTHPASDRFEPQRYWRGPVWLHINWMIAEGLSDYGYADLAERVKQATRKCVDESGFYEYFDAQDRCRLRWRPVLLDRGCGAILARLSGSTSNGTSGGTGGS